MTGSLLRKRDFRLVAGAVGLSAFGDWVAIVALGLHVTDISDSGYVVAALWVCLFGPSVLLAGHAGLLVDRIETRRLLAAVSSLGAVVAAVLAFTTGTAMVLALTAALGLVFAILQPAEFALVPPLAGNRIQEANGHVETARYVGFGLGPVLGGLLFSAGGLELAMLVDAATFVAVAGAALALRVRRDPSTIDEADVRAARSRRGRLPVRRPGAVADDDRGVQLASVHVRGVGRRAVLRAGRAWAGGRRLRAVPVHLDDGNGGRCPAAVAPSGGGRGGRHRPRRRRRPGRGPCLPRVVARLRLLPGVLVRRRPGTRGEERHVPKPHPRSRSRAPARARVRRLQRDP